MHCGIDAAEAFYRHFGFTALTDARSAHRAVT
jgi:hypothetical protein